MSEWLQYGALGVLALTIAAVGFFLRQVIAPLATELIKVLPQIPGAANRLESHVVGMRSSLAALVERTETSRQAHERQTSQLEEIGQDVRDLHHQQFGTNGGTRAATGSRGSR